MINRNIVFYLKHNFSKINIPYNEFQYIYSRSSGPGGQSVNKLNTKVELRVNLDKAEQWLPLHIKNQLYKLCSNKISSNGELILTSQETRSQQDNKKIVEEKFENFINLASKPENERLFEGVVEQDHHRLKRIQDKKKRSDVKKLRNDI